MSVSLTLNFSSIAEAAAFLAANGGAQIAKAEVKETVIKPAADAKPTTAKAAVEQALKATEEAAAKKEVAAAEAKAAAENTDDLAGGESAPVLDYDTDVKPKFQAFLKAKGRDAGLALLAKYKVKSGTELPKDRLHEVLADIEAAG